MKTPQSNNTENLSWFQLVIRNNSLIVAIFLVAFGGVLFTKVTQYPMAGDKIWAYLILGIITVTPLAIVIYSGMYGHWKEFNGSKGWKVWTIMRGKHRSFLVRMPWFLHPYKRTRTFFLSDRFFDAYQRGDDDTHKLYGYGFGFLPFKKAGKWHPAHHKFSWRIGVRIDGSQEASIVGYIYYNGERTTTHSCLNIKKGDIFRVSEELAVGSQHLDITVVNERTQQRLNFNYKLPNKDYGFRLGFTFGGDRVAPHNVQLFERKY